jgi:simple sugar transport system permease protein
MAALETGSDALQILKLPSAMGEVMQGLILIPLLAGSVFTEYRLAKSGTHTEATA